MKISSRILAIILLFTTMNSSAQNFQWAKRAGLYAFDLGYGIGTDNAGNVYIAGKYEQKANFGGTTVGCAGNHDIYIAKYSPGGSFLWVRTAGGSIGDYAHALAVDGAGNSYLTGEFETTTRFGSGAVTLKSSGSNDIFVAKYDTNGNLIWAKKLAGGGGSDRGLGISVSNGGVYVTGNFQGGANFSGTQLNSSGGHDIFIAKYTTGGVFQWAKRAGGSGEDEGFAISNDSGGNAYVTGYFTGTANFSGTSVSSKGGYDIFLAKYNPSGTLLWVKKFGGTANDAGNAIKVNSSGIFLTGGFRNTTLFGSISLKTPNGNSDIFIARLDFSGNVIWAKKAGGTDNDTGRGIAVDGSSNCFITGNCGKSATFGSTTINGADITEIYFASYDASGNYRWVLKVGGAADVSDPDRFIEMGLSIATDPSGNVVGSGAYRSSSTFGGTTLSPFSTHTDVYVTKIGASSKMLADSLGAQITPLKNATFCSGADVLLKTQQDSSYAYTWFKNDLIIKGATGATYNANSAGTYKVMIISENDTVTTDPTVVTESKSISVSLAPSDPIFCQDTSTVLITNTGDNYVYQWKRNGITIPGANQKYYKTDKSGDYQVKIIQGACFDWSGVTNISLQNCIKPDSTINITKEIGNNNNTRSIEIKDDSLLIKIYPNPNSGLFTLEINMVHQLQQTDQVKVEIINSIGQIVYNKVTSFENGYINEHIELENSIPVGIYFLQVTIGDKVEKTRMMLAR
ncbi:MAG: SBBP repeat-containing protein [Bacteroidetes bacterium]|nr:SBBP repeat-containing protein [Bacteroidota bacterium]